MSQLLDLISSCASFGRRMHSVLFLLRNRCVSFGRRFRSALIEARRTSIPVLPRVVFIFATLRHLVLCDPV